MCCGDGRGLSVLWGWERVECVVGDGRGLSVVWGTGEG